jgi:hypothetical protein
MHLRPCGLFAFIAAAFFFVLLPTPVIRADDLLTGTAQPVNSDKIQQSRPLKAGVRLQRAGKPEEPAVAGPPTVKQSGGKQAEAKMVELPMVKTAQPCRSQLVLRAGWPGSAAIPVSVASTRLSKLA